MIDIVRAKRPCDAFGPPCILGSVIPKHAAGREGHGVAQAHTRDAYAFLKQRLEKDGEPQTCNAQEAKHSISYIHDVRERLNSPHAEVCRPW